MVATYPVWGGRDVGAGCSKNRCSIRAASCLVCKNMTYQTVWKTACSYSCLKPHLEPPRNARARLLVLGIAAILGTVFFRHLFCFFYLLCDFFLPYSISSFTFFYPSCFFCVCVCCFFSVNLLFFLFSSCCSFPLSSCPLAVELVVAFAVIVVFVRK